MFYRERLMKNQTSLPMRLCKFQLCSNGKQKCNFSHLKLHVKNRSKIFVKIGSRSWTDIEIAHRGRRQDTSQMCQALSTEERREGGGEGTYFNFVNLT